MKNLERLSLSENKNITDAGIAHLARLENLRELRIRNSRLTSAALAHLIPLPNLEKLGMGMDAVDAPTLGRLRSMENLRELELNDSRANRRLQIELEERYPKLRVVLRGK